MENVIKNKSRNVDMTKGPILKGILLFALPLFVGNLFQQLYNIIDSIVVGKYEGTEALAAVSSSGSLTSFLVSLIVGIASGAGIVIARHFGARDKKRMSDAIHTLVAFGLVSGVVLTIVGYFLTPQMLIWMNTDEEVLPESTVYFRTYFLGVIFTVMYNVGSAIFRAIGDSRHPLYYLILASLVNVLLDLLFVGYFNMGVRGVAIGTIISQAISAIATMLHLMVIKTDYTVYIRKIRFHSIELISILKIGLPNGLQNSIISLANVFIQSNINSFGKIVQAGCGTYTKIEGFATLPSGSFSTAISNYVGQNMGAKEYERVKKGSRIGLLTSMLMCEGIGLLLCLFAPFLIKMFSDDPEVIKYGVSMTRHIAWAYFMLSFAHGISGVLRGAGISTIPMITMIICWCGVRVLGIPIALHFWNDVRTIFMFYPLTWFISLVVLGVYFLKVDWINKGKKMD